MMNGNNNKKEEPESLPTPEKPDDLTKEFLTQILEREYGPPRQLQSFEWRDADVGVLSRVVYIDVEYTTTAAASTGTKQQRLVAKFLKPEFPLVHMFLVESHFYRHVKPKVVSFQIPRPVHTSSSLILIEHVATDQGYHAVDGCPSQLVAPIVTRLGKLHSQFLGYHEEGLASPAGIGSTASGIMKETQFPGMWQDFLRDIPDLDEPARNRVSEICQQLSTRRLRDIHDTIHNHPVQTLIHGDCHVANMLFETDNIWLIDWAACGRGNPLIDLAFFTIVSLDIQVRKEKETEMLQAYYDAFGPGSAMSQEACQEMYRRCLLNQFIILVVYDRMARRLAEQAKRPEKLTHHFNVVNARACHAVMDNFGDDLLPRQKTKEEAALQPEGDVGL